jgi:hypothetical protein
MKKLFTFSFISLFVLFYNINIFSQCLTCTDKEYTAKKEQFYKEFLVYKTSLDKNIVVPKPIDPNGLFYIDDNNIFNMKLQGVNTPWNNFTAPWPQGNEKDAVTQYSFSQSTTTYTPAYGGTLLCAAGCDDGNHSGIAIPFTFNYNGTAYTTVSIQQNGWMVMGTQSPSGYSPICTGSYPNVIAAFARDLYGLAAGDSLRYLTTGTTPNRVFTVEWSKWGIYSSGLNELSFQINLYETSNIIKIVYKPETPTTSITDVQVGLMGATTADFANRTSTTSWASSTAGSTACSYMYFSSTNYPASGLTFTYTPPVVGPMGYLSSNTVQLGVNVPYLPSSVNNQIVQVQVADTGSLTPLIINKLRFQTTGSTNPAVDIANAKLYYTRSTATFSITRQYGSTVTSPNGVFNFSDTASLDPNATNYFWLTYDLTPGAVNFDSLDAQCDSIIGTSPMGGVVPTTTAPVGFSTVDSYCRGTVTTAGCSYNIYISNVNFGNINNTTACNSTMPYVYTNYTNLSTTVRQNNQYGMTISIPAYTNATAFGIWIDWNNNNSFADAGEYYASSIITSALVNPATSTITVPPGALLGNHRMRIRANLSSPPTSASYCANLSYGEQEDYTVNVLADTNMTYTSSTTTQTVVSGVFSPSPNTQIIGIQVNTAGTISPINATSFSLNTTGSTNPAADISNAKLWYTGLSSSFATSTLFGLSVAPNGTYTITGSQALVQGTNYFWLTYDVPSTAVNGDSLDAQCTSMTIGGIGRIPTVTSPAGFRIINGSALCGTFNIPSGAYPTIASAITDLNTKGTPICAVTFNVAAGYVETAANLTLTTTGTFMAPITFRKSGTGDNPRVRAGVGTGSYDGIIKLYGANYITFDGIDLTDTSTNTTTTTQMEWGYALLRPDGTRGNQYNTIKNCNITLNKTNTTTYGIYSHYMTTGGATNAVTSPAGTNSNNSFLSNNISNCYSGYYLYSYSDGTAPYAMEDQNNTVNNTGSGRSSITNFGGTATTAYGIYAYYQRNPNFSNTLINSTGGTNSTGYIYGIYNYAYYNNANNVISGDTITLVTGGTATYLYGIYNYTYHGVDNFITNNVLTGFVNPVTGTGYTYYIYNYNASGSNIYQNSFTVTGNKIFGNTFGTATALGGTYDIYSYDYCMNYKNISNNLDSGNTILGTTAYQLYGIYSSGTTYNARVSNNKVSNNTLTGTTATGTMYGVYNAGGTITCIMDSNIVANNNAPSTSSGTWYCMYNAAPAPSNDFSYNTVTGNSASGSQTMYSMFYSAAPGLGSTVNINNNTITNQSKLTATGIGTIYGIYQGSSPAGTLNINNNTVTGFTSAAATGLYGLYQAGSPPNYLNINNNKVGNFTSGGAGIIYGIYTGGTTTTQSTISQDSIFNLTSLGGTIYGMYCVNGNPANIFRNKISGISSTTGTTAVVYGMYVSGGTINNIYNNVISDINAPASTSNPAVSGIYLAGGTYDNLYYNTVLLKATSTSATTFSTNALYASTTPNVDLRNNILADSSTPGPTTSYSVAYRRSAFSLATYNNASNNNCFYAGTPSASHLIYYDVTNSSQTLAAYKTLVVPRDNNSISEMPPFMSTTAPYDLRINTSVATGLESGAQIISTPVNITNDGFGVARYPNSGYPIGGFTPTNPDIGANEFGGLRSGATGGPFISYTPLGIGGTANRAFNNVIITDPAGVNTTTGTKPRCYYKRSTDGTSINDNTSATDGWKYVEANGTTSPFDFTINYSLLFGGTGVVAGQVVQYFVIAQDLDATPEVSANQATFTTAPTTVALLAANTPITNTLTYTIGTNTFSGSYNVGTSYTYTSLTGAAGIFAAINAGTVSGDITINITSDLTEDGTNALNALNETGVGGYKVKIVPSSGSMKTISGSVTQGMIRFNGCRRVTIDGNGGFGVSSLKLDGLMAAPSKYLTFRNIGGSYPAFTFQNEAIKDTIKNCYVESNNISTISGTILFSTTTGINGNDSNVIAYCDIRDITGLPANGIYSLGTGTTLQTYNNYNKIVGCNIYNNFYDASAVIAGIYLNSYSSDWTIDSCSFYQTASRVVTGSSTFCGIYVASTLNNNILITNSYFGGTAPQCGSSAMTYSGTGLYNYNAISLLPGSIVASSVQGNTIKNISLTASPASGASSAFFRGIYINTTGFCNIGNITGNTIGSPTGTGSIALTINTTTTGFTNVGIYAASIGNISNNTVGSITLGGNSITTTQHYVYGIQLASTVPGWTYTLNNNLIGSISTPNSIQLNDSLSPQYLRGIVLSNGAGTINNITNNIVANCTNNAQATTSNTVASVVYGFSFSNAGNDNITNNSIYNLTLNTNVILPNTFLLGGITHSSTTSINNISQNTISGLYLNCYATGVTLNTGMFVGGAAGSVVSRNKVYDLRYSGTATTTSIEMSGIFMASTIPGTNTVSNNMVSLTNGDPTDVPFSKTNNLKHENITLVENQTAPAWYIFEHSREIKDVDPNAKPAPVGLCSADPTPKINNGKKDEVTSVNTVSIGGIVTQSGSSYKNTCNYFYNTVYIGGSQPGGSTYSSWAFLKQNGGELVLRNNLFINARTGGSGYHFVVGNEASPAGNSWYNTSSTYNSFLGSSDATIGEWGLGNALTLGQWVVATGGDNQSYATNTATVLPASLLTNVATCDLSILSGYAGAWLVSGKGIAISGMNVDYTNDPRATSISGGCTDIGADEFTATPPSNPVATQVGTPVQGGLSDYFIYGRKICTIDWGLGGTSYPTSLSVNYYSGINPPNTGTLGPNFSNSYWTVVPTGTLAGTAYNIRYYFGDNETYTIPSPNINTILGKYDYSAWQGFALGTGALQSDLNWNNLSVIVRGLNLFSTFALADGSMAVNLISPPNNAQSQPTTLNLVWNKFAGALTYRVQVATDSAFNTIVVNDSTVADSIKSVTLSSNTVYFWRVRGKTASASGPYSAIWKFNTYIALSAPTLIAPPNNATNVAQAPLFDWSDVPTATNYRLQVSTNSGFTGTMAIDVIVSGVSQYQSPNLLLNTLYYWRVKSRTATDSSAFTSAFSFTTENSIIVNLTIIPGGFFNSSTSQLNMRDTLRILLVDTISGGHRRDSCKVIVDSVAFTCQAKFDNAPSGNYYIYIYHRNHLPISTASIQVLSRTAPTAYNFTDAANKTYGSNVIQVSTSPARWGMIPGDANQDEYVDAFDQFIWIAQNGLDGYLSADFNGDTYVDAFDQFIWIAYNGNSSFLPVIFPGPTQTSPIRNSQGVKKAVIDNRQIDFNKQKDFKNQNDLKK